MTKFFCFFSEFDWIRHLDVAAVKYQAETIFWPFFSRIPHPHILFNVLIGCQKGKQNISIVSFDFLKATVCFFNTTHYLITFGLFLLTGKIQQCPPSVQFHFSGGK